NKDNSSRSTGPTSAAGKARSALNSLVHEMTLRQESSLGPAALVRVAQIAASLGPRSHLEELAAREIARWPLNIERCRDQELVTLATLVDRAASPAQWKEDRAREVDKLAARLPRRPQSVARQLKSTRAGVEWMLEQWAVLSVGLDAKGGWTIEEVHTACDLMGIRPEDRAHSPKITISDEDSARAMVEREVAKLETLLEEGLGD